MKRPYERSARVADLIQKALAKIVQQEAHEPSFSLVTVMSVELARDFSFAKVYVSALLDDEEKIKAVVAALNRSAKSFRYLLAKEVKMRIVPELRFVFDESTAHGFHISTLIDAAVKKTGKE